MDMLRRNLFNMDGSVNWTNAAVLAVVLLVVVVVVGYAYDIEMIKDNVNAVLSMVGLRDELNEAAEQALIEGGN